jgi:hypothetical protein
VIDFSVGSCQAVTVTDNITMRFVLSVLLTDAYIVALLSAVVSARGRRAVCIVLYVLRVVEDGVKRTQCLTIYMCCPVAEDWFSRLGVGRNSDDFAETPWPESANELYLLSDRRLAKLVPSFAYRGWHVVSVTDP